MLGRLKRQFVLITVALTGAVLVAVLGSTLWTTWSTQHGIIEEALDRGLEDDLDYLPRMGEDRAPRGEGGDGDDMGRRVRNMVALAVDVTSSGVIVKSSKAPVIINSSVLSEVVKTALASPEDSGDIPDLHIAWKRRLYYVDYEDEYDVMARVVIVDTTALDSAFREQVRSSAFITAGALVALFAISWLLASLALKPVAAAWEQQRRFVADASHELKTPLAVILANSEILSRDATLAPETRRWVDSTLDEANHMKGLVNELLELARADESARGEATTALHKEDVDLSDMVEASALEFDALAFERGCTIDAQVENGIHVHGDREWLVRLTKILIDNACKYADEGTEVTVSLTKAKGHAVLTVTNFGAVIDPEDLPHLFDRFYRSDKVRTRGAGGFGLGLAIAKGIVEAHGGKITATSDVTNGTRFVVTL